MCSNVKKHNLNQLFSNYISHFSRDVMPYMCYWISPVNENKNSKICI